MALKTTGKGQKTINQQCFICIDQDSRVISSFYANILAGDYEPTTLQALAYPLGQKVIVVQTASATLALYYD